MACLTKSPSSTLNDTFRPSLLKFSDTGFELVTDAKISSTDAAAEGAITGAAVTASGLAAGTSWGPASSWAAMVLLHVYSPDWLLAKCCSAATKAPARTSFSNYAQLQPATFPSQGQPSQVLLFNRPQAPGPR